MGAEVELHRLVDLALRSPDAGVVNFNHLHTLLHAILNHIGLNYKTLSGAINLPLASSNGNEKPSRFQSERSKAEEKDVTEQYNSNPGDTSEQPFGHNIALSDQERRNFASLQTKQEDLEKKIQELEDRLKIFDHPHSNKYIIEQEQQLKQLNQYEGSAQNDLSGMWQLMKFNKRLQATEDAIDRIMAILNEFLGSDGKAISGLKSDLEDVANELKNLKGNLFGPETEGGDNSRQRLMAKMLGGNDATSRLRSLEEQLKTFVRKDELGLYVKWPALEEAMNIKKTDLEKRHSNVLNVWKSTDVSSDLAEKENIASTELVDKGNEESDTESDGRAQTAPLPSTLHTPIPTPDCPKTAFTQSTQVNVEELHPSVGYPSAEMVECLRQISELSDKHSKVEKHLTTVTESQHVIAGTLSKVEQALPQKVSKEDLNIPDDLQEQLAMLKQGLEYLNTNRDSVALAEVKNMSSSNKEHIEGIKRELAAIARLNKQNFMAGVVTQSPGIDSSVLDAIRDHLTELQSEHEKLGLTTDRQHSELLEDLNRKQEHIEALYRYVEKLQESKADKDNVAMEMDIKADKAALDSKVNVSTFDNSFNILDEGLREAFQKMDDYMNEELALKQALKQLSDDMSEKMDGQAFQALKNYLEKRIADVQKSRSLIAAETKMGFADAAGFRKPIRFNCISCSRPVELPLRGPLQAQLPAARGVRTKRSKGPYLSYEMDQIRQHQRGHYGGAKVEKALSDIISGRPCGGSHTIIYHPSKRRSKTTQLSQVPGARDEPSDGPNWGRELSVIDMLKGSDGHLYKGRFRQTIPPIPKSSQSTPRECESSLSREESLGTSTQSTSRPSSPRNPAVGEAVDTQPVNVQSHSSPSLRTRMKQIVERHGSDSPPNPIPAPSPPTLRETESWKALLKQQRQAEDTHSKLFIPTAPRPSPVGARENEDTDHRGTGDDKEDVTSLQDKETPTNFGVKVD
ncbi:restin homolog [Montipora capricornis]|uniref:restin homolog n=1 Tax=Montipora capricornis TaxID=246305 RepID=UPI0035F1E619